MKFTARASAEIVDSALTMAAAGDILGGGLAIRPLMNDGYGSAYALAAMLAEVASRTARETPLALIRPETFTGDSSPVDNLAPDLRFAVRFTVAWANRDQDTSEALFVALIKLARLTGGHEFVDGLLQLYRMAVDTERDRTRAGLPNDRLPAPDGPADPKDPTP